MRELHLPDGKPVVINPQLVTYLYAFGEDATLIGFSGSGTITVQGSYEDVLVDLGLLDDTPHPEAAPVDEHDEFDDAEEDHLVEEEDEEEPEQRTRQRDSFPF